MSYGIDDVKHALSMCDAAGITLEDVAKIIAVSRTTLSRWRHEHQPPTDSFRVNALVTLGGKLKDAVDKGRLPLRMKITRRKERVATIKRILSECSNTL